MWDLGSSHSTDRRHNRYDYGYQYADPDVPVYRSHRSSHRPQRSQSTGRYLSHKARPRSGTAADYYNGGAIQPYHEQESPKQRGRSSTFKDFFKGFNDSDHGLREREHERGRHHRSNSNSSTDHDFATTLLGGAVGGLAGRHYGHTASGAAAGALAAKFLEHELHKHKEEEDKHKHRHHHHHHHSSPYRHHHHHSSPHHHHHSSRQYRSPEESAKDGYAYGYDESDYVWPRSSHRHRSSSDASRRSHLSSTRYPAGVRY